MDSEKPEEKLARAITTIKQRLIRFIKENKYFFIAFSLMGGWYLIWWLAFYPGTLSPDSISQWMEATTGHLTNASPYLYALIFSWLIKLKETPAVMGLFQGFLLTFVVSWSLNYFVKKGLSLKIYYLVIFLYIFLPQYGIYNVTIWKDVLYAYTLLAALVTTYLLVLEPTRSKSNLFIFYYAAIIAAVPLMRFNGLFIIPFIPVFLLLIKKMNIKKAAVLFFLSLIFYIGINFALASLLKVQKAPLMIEGVTVKAVGAIYHMKNPRITEDERSVFNHIIPENRWKKSYSCVSVDELFYKELAIPKKLSIFDKGIDKNPEVVKDWHRSVVTASIRNPEAIIFDKVCLSAYLFGVKNTLYKYELNIWKPKDRGPIVVADSRLPVARKYLTKYLKGTSGNSSENVYWKIDPVGHLLSRIFWGAIIPLLFFLYYGVRAFRDRLWGTFGYVSVMIVNLGTTALLVPAGSFRYIYALYAAFPLLFAIYYYELSLSKKKS